MTKKGKKKLLAAVAAGWQKRTCPGCGRRFASKKVMEKHIDTEHPLQAAPQPPTQNVMLAQSNSGSQPKTDRERWYEEVEKLNNQLDHERQRRYALITGASEALKELLRAI
jgi:hypothetical protein